MKTTTDNNNRTVQILPVEDAELATVEGGRDYWGWERLEMASVPAFKDVDASTPLIGR